MTKAPIKLTARVCREQADNCRKAAKATMTAAHRIMLEHIADTWLRIAADINTRNNEAATVGASWPAALPAAYQPTKKH